MEFNLKDYLASVSTSNMSEFQDMVDKNVKDMGDYFMSMNVKGISILKDHLESNEQTELFQHVLAVSLGVMQDMEWTSEQRALLLLVLMDSKVGLVLTGMAITTAMGIAVNEEWR